jgi:hypothetical protein
VYSIFSVQGINVHCVYVDEAANSKEVLGNETWRILSEEIGMYAIVHGASKIKLKKVNKKRTVTVRRVIIFLNISRHPLLI